MSIRETELDRRGSTVLVPDVKRIGGELGSDPAANDEFYDLAIEFFGKLSNINSNVFKVEDLANTLRRIEYIRRLASDKNRRLRNLKIISVIANPAYLLYCMVGIRNKRSKGIDDVITQGLTMKGIIKLSKELSFGTYKPAPTKRVNIPKESGGTRPLGIASTRDKVVQVALKPILEAIYEPTFRTSSHGFRPGHSCHSALREIESK